MLPRCSAAFFFILVFIFGIAVADHRTFPDPAEAGSAFPLAVTALSNTPLLISAQVDDQEIRQSSPPSVAPPRGASGEQGKWVLFERQPDWLCLAELCFKLADACAGDIKQLQSTTRLATGPPASAA